MLPSWLLPQMDADSLPSGVLVNHTPFMDAAQEDARKGREAGRLKVIETRRRRKPHHNVRRKRVAK